MSTLTPMTDEMEQDCHTGIEGSLNLARQLETELATLRANLERLADRWEGARAESGIVGQSGNNGAIHAVNVCTTQLRRVLSGETPPEAGKEWA